MQLRNSTNASLASSYDTVTHVPYDSYGAAKYVIVVIAWYFLSVASFVAWQIKRKRGTNDYKSELLMQKMEEQVKTKEILEELRNPNMRKWAWSIYTEGKNMKSRHSIDIYEARVLENLNKRINHIEKKKLKFNEDYNTSNSVLFSEQSLIGLDHLSNRIRTRIKNMRRSVPSISTSSLNHQSQYSLSKKSFIDATLVKMETIIETDQIDQLEMQKSHVNDKNPPNPSFEMKIFSEKMTHRIQRKMFKTQKNENLVNGHTSNQSMSGMQKSASEANFNKLLIKNEEKS